jgi:hypothetical protein
MSHPIAQWMGVSTHFPLRDHLLKLQWDEKIDLEKDTDYLSSGSVRSENRDNQERSGVSMAIHIEGGNRTFPQRPTKNYHTLSYANQKSQSPRVMAFLSISRFLTIGTCIQRYYRSNDGSGRDHLQFFQIGQGGVGSFLQRLGVRFLYLFALG